MAGDGIDGIYHIKALGEKLNAIYASKVIDNDGDLGTTEDQTAVEGWLISLFDGSNNLIDTLRTDANGQVLFSPFDYNLPNGIYTVVEEDVEGYQALSPLERRS